ncbi:hypothetical protein LAZ67_2001895 [Cordylochernes scorpioides]|uniref:Peptidase aspartic putative domain-containing protein n=1 Tax=Cordylochernes scorpioides TaxID=51811 RepID=A0ABY6K3B4_9ARAC|nr:hypothetical protein LAZ67_2001895 [Cordylochernes scorpioides]
MDKLKKACETKKRTLESVIAEADGELGKQEPSLEMLMSLRPKLLRCKDRFLIASDCLIEQLIKADREDEEIEDVDIVQANLFGRSEGLLQKMEQLLAKPTVDRESIVSGGNEGKSNLHRLPKLELPKFGGEAREWLQFWSAFQSVHDDDSISACVKFQYLQNCMIKGSVSEEIVSSFPNSAANYPLVISTLKERFGREDMLVEVYVRDLIAIILENAHGRNTTSFSTVYVRLSSQLRALGSLGVTTDKCAAILYPMVESALPEDLFVAWERTRHHHKPDEDGKHKSSEVLLEKLMEFLKHEVEGSERMRLARQPFSSSYPSQFNRDKPPKPKTSVATAASLIDGENKSKVVRAMLDSGSQNSYVLEQTASEVGLTMLGKKEVVHLLFGGVKSRPQQHKRYRIYISDVDSKYNCNFEVQDCSTICSAMPSAQPTEWMTELRSKGIDLDVYRSNTEIELLLGADVYAKLLTGKKIELESGPVALETKLGWTVLEIPQLGGGVLPWNRSDQSVHPDHNTSQQSCLVRMDILFWIDVYHIEGCKDGRATVYVVRKSCYWPTATGPETPFALSSERRSPSSGGPTVLDLSSWSRGPCHHHLLSGESVEWCRSEVMQITPEVPTSSDLRREALVLFSNSVVTGARRLVVSRGLELLAQVLVWLLCFGFFVYQTWRYVDIYLGYPVTLSVTLEYPESVMLPATTLCTRYRQAFQLLYDELSADVDHVFAELGKINMNVWFILTHNNMIPNFRKSMIAFHSPYSLANPYDGGIEVGFYQYALIKIKMTEIVKLPYPYVTDCRSYIEEWKVHRSGPLSKEIEDILLSMKLFSILLQVKLYNMQLYYIWNMWGYRRGLTIDMLQRTWAV